MKQKKGTATVGSSPETDRLLTGRHDTARPELQHSNERGKCFTVNSDDLTMFRPGWFSLITSFEEGATNKK